MNETKRPLIVTLIAIFFILAFIISMDNIFAEKETQNYIVWYYNFSILVTVLSLITAIGLLMMRKFAVYLYIIHAPISFLIQLKVVGTLNFYGVLLSLALIIILTKYLDKMK